MSAKLAMDHEGYLIRDHSNITAASTEQFANEDNTQEQVQAQWMKDLLEQRKKDFVYL